MTDWPPKPTENKWYDRHSPYLKTPRAEAEDELLALSATYPSTVLNLSGLWGGARSPKNWVERTAGTKELLRDKVRAVHFFLIVYEWLIFLCILG